MTQHDIPEFKSAPVCDETEWDCERFPIKPAADKGEPKHDEYVEMRRRYSGRKRIGYTGPAVVAKNSPSKIKGNPQLQLNNVLITFKRPPVREWRRPYIEDVEGNEYQITGIDGEVCECTPKEQA